MPPASGSDDASAAPMTPGLLRTSSATRCANSTMFSGVAKCSPDNVSPTARRSSGSKPSGAFRSFTKLTPKSPRRTPGRTQSRSRPPRTHAGRAARRRTRRGAAGARQRLRHVGAIEEQRHQPEHRGRDAADRERETARAKIERRADAANEIRRWHPDGEQVRDPAGDQDPGQRAGQGNPDPFREQLRASAPRGRRRARRGSRIRAADRRRGSAAGWRRSRSSTSARRATRRGRSTARAS